MRTHLLSIFQTVFTMGPPSRHHMHPLQTLYFILTLSCAFLIFNLITDTHRKEKREVAVPKTRGSPRVLTFALPCGILDH